MLQTRQNSVHQDTTPPEFRSPAESVADGLAFLRRRLSIILLTCFLTLGVALLYLITAVPTFTATAQLVIDAKAASADAASVSTVVESQIGIMKSEGIARAVIQKLVWQRIRNFPGGARAPASAGRHPGCSAGANRKRKPA